MLDKNSINGINFYSLCNNNSICIGDKELSLLSLYFARVPSITSAKISTTGVIFRVVNPNGQVSNILVNTTMNSKNDTLTDIVRIYPNESTIDNAVVSNFRKSEQLKNTTPSILPLNVKISKVSTISETLGFAKIKNSYIGQTVKLMNIRYIESLKLGTKVLVAEVLCPNEKVLKFDAADIEIALPNTKGYNPPKDREIREKDSVKCVNNRGINANRGEHFIVEKILTKSKKTKDRYDVFICSNVENFSKKIRGFRKHFKKV